MSKMEQARVGSGFAILKNGFERKVEIWRSYLVIQEKSRRFRYCFTYNHNYNKILKSDWFSTALISALIGQFNRTVRIMPK